MTTIDVAVAEAVRMFEARETRNRVGAADDDVADRLMNLAAAGYCPDHQVVAPVRDFLSGFGLLLSGPAGVGKTFLMKSLGVPLYGVESLCDYGPRHIHQWFEWTDGIGICIDDLGAESTSVDYGARDDMLKVVIGHRAERQSATTHVTTNLTADEIAARYGDRILSRLLGICRPHKMTGLNRRTT